MADGVIPVHFFCKVCGWASGSNLKPLSGCGRCGIIEVMQLVVPNKGAPIVQGAMMESTGMSPVQVLPTPSSNSAAAPTLDRPKKIKKVLGPEEKISPDNFASPAPAFTISLDQVKKNTAADPNWQGNTNNPKFHIDDKKVQDPKPNNKKLKHVNRRSRAYSWQFVKNVVNPKNDLAIPNPVLEEPANMQARPVVKRIVELVPMYGTINGPLASDVIEKLLTQEKEQGTPWREIADETIMELILNGLSAFNFIVALINAYNIPTSDVGLFLATPPDEGTMSLIEEAVCQESLDLFLEVLKMDQKLLKGLLECKDTTEQVHREIFDLLNDMGAAEE